MGRKSNVTVLFWDVDVVAKKELVTSIKEKVVAGDYDFGNSRRIGPDPVVCAQLIPDPAHMAALGSKKSALPLGQVGISLNHQGFYSRSWVERDLYPEMTSKEMAKDITLGLLMVVGMFRKSPDILLHVCVNPGRATWHLKLPVVCLAGRI